MTTKHQDAQPVLPNPGEWAECLRISELPEIDEALRLFAEGETSEDQAVCIVQAVRRAALAAQQAAEPVYQLQLAGGSWVDQTKSSYDYNNKSRGNQTRVLYTHAPATPQATPLDAGECCTTYWRKSDQHANLKGTP
jgi:hypothetical protein